jgi:hypothetical protein
VIKCVLLETRGKREFKACWPSFLEILLDRRFVPSSSFLDPRSWHSGSWRSGSWTLRVLRALEALEALEALNSLGGYRSLRGLRLPRLVCKLWLGVPRVFRGRV